MGRTAKLAVAVGIGLVVLCAIIASIPRDSATATPTPASAAIQPTVAPTDRPTVAPTATNAPIEPTPTNTMTANLAIIEGVENDPEKVTQIALLLVDLDKAYPETDQEIGDLTAQVHSVLTDKGKPAGIIEIMEEMLKLAGSAPGLTYKDAVTTWATLRTS